MQIIRQTFFQDQGKSKKIDWPGELEPCQDVVFALTIVVSGCRFLIVVGRVVH